MASPTSLTCTAPLCGFTTSSWCHTIVQALQHLEIHVNTRHMQPAQTLRTAPMVPMASVQEDKTKGPKIDIKSTGRCWRFFKDD